MKGSVSILKYCRNVNFPLFELKEPHNDLQALLFNSVLLIVIYLGSFALEDEEVF